MNARELYVIITKAKSRDYDILEDEVYYKIYYLEMD